MTKIKTVLTAVLLAASTWLAKSQTVGTTSTNPIIVSSGSHTLTANNPVGTETWYKWTNTEVEFDAYSKINHNAGQYQVYSADLYVYGGGSLVLHINDSLRNDSTLRFFATNISTGDIVYLKINAANSCTSCAVNNTDFNVIFRDEAILSCPTYTNPGNCEHVYDPGMEYFNVPCGSLGYSTNHFVYDNEACYWKTPSVGSCYAMGSPDYINNCATASQYYTTPYGTNLYTTAHLGSGCSGIFCDPITGYYEYVRNSLYIPLTAGSTYSASMWVKLMSQSKYAIKDLNAVLSPSAPCQGTVSFMSFPASGQSIPFGNSWLTNKTGWTQLTATFTASTNHAWLTIGSFTSVGGTNNYNLNDATTMSTYYFIDDISITDVFNVGITASSTSGCANETFTLNSTYSASSYTWSGPGGFSSNSTSVAITPTTTSIYTLSATSSGGCIKTATMQITTYTCCANPNANNITLRSVNLVPNGTSGAIPWSALTVGGYYTGNIAVPVPSAGTSLITNTLSIVNGFSINANVTFSLCNMAMTETVTITQNQPTYIYNSYLWGCDKLWNGIASYTNLTVSNSWIEDAYNAINAGYFMFLTTHPGINIDNVMFNKNYVGISVGTTSMNPAYLQITGSIFSSRNFGAANYTTTTRYTSLFPNISAKPPVKLKGSSYYSITANTIRSDMGIYIPNLLSNTTTPYFTIGAAACSSCSPSNSDLTNAFDYLNAGIYNTGSNISIINNRFSNMITTGTGTAIGAVVHANSNTPHDTKTEIGRSSAGDPGTSSYKNIFGYGTSTQILDGVAASGGGTLTVNYNDFRYLTRYGVSVSGWSATTPSVELVTIASNSYTESAYAFYGYNNVKINASIGSNTVMNIGATYSNNTNVYLNEIGKPSTATYHVHDNVFTGTLKGVYALNTYGTRIIGNNITINKPGTGIYNADITLDNSDMCMVSQNAISCNPTNSSSWYTQGIIANSSASNTIKCNTITKVGNCLKFQYSCPSTTIYKNSLNNTSGADPCAVGVVVQACSSIGSIGFPLSGGGFGQSDDIWGDFSSSDTYCSSNSNTLITTDKIYYDNSNSGSKPLTLYQPQVNAAAPLPDISVAFAPTPTTALNTDGCNESARMISPSVGKNSNVATKGGINNVESGMIESVPTKNRKRVLLYTTNSSNNARGIGNNNDELFFEVDSLLTLFAQTKDNSALNSAKNINSGISANGQMQINQKEFNSIYATFLQGDSLVTEGQKQSLITLAWLCPNTDGLAVYQARGLIRKWDDSTEYFNECERILPEIATNPEAAQRLLSNASNNPALVKPLNVYPNPNSGKLTVENSPENSIFELYDIVGRKIYSNTVGNVTQLDLTPFNNGTYLYKIVKDGRTVKEDKLILNK